MGVDFNTAPKTNPKIELSQKGKDALTAHGWDKGYVAFGFSTSESVARIAVGLPIAGKSNVKWVTVSFDDGDLEDIPEGFDPNFMTPGSKQKMGVKSELFSLITGGRASMPALAIDGEMYMDSNQILKMLAVEQGAPAKVLELIDWSVKYNPIILEALKHWGWTHLHAHENYAMVNEEHYKDYGKGKKSKDWEKKTTDSIKTFMNKLEQVLASKPEINGYFIGDEFTLADAALFNFVYGIEGGTGLDVKKHYPNCYENWEKNKANPPYGSQHYVYGFPVLCGYVAAANKDIRESGFDINKYWE